MAKIKVAVAGLGNCASSFIQGLEYYKTSKENELPGLMHEEIGGYYPGDIEVVAAFDIDERKVDKPLNEAVLAEPNCTHVFAENIQPSSVIVKKGPVLDGVSDHLKDYPADRRFQVSETEECDVVSELKDSGAEILLNYLPVGSVRATEFYANSALQAGVAFINCIPVFIGSDPEWIDKFKQAGLPIVGDDIKTQVGATIIHRVLTKMFTDRGVRMDRTYQLNIGGNTDFLNMLNPERLSMKKTSKTEAVQSQMENPLATHNIHIGPSDYVPWLNDNKICYIRIEGTQFGGMKVELDVKLSVEDSPNSAAVVMDAVRCCKLALDRGTAGALTSVAAYTMKHPPQQVSDETARWHMEQFIKGDRER